MKRFILVSILALASFAAFADEPAKQPTPEQSVKEVVAQAVVAKAKEAVTANTGKAQSAAEDAKLNARLADAIKVTQDRVANMTAEEKAKLVDDLNHPDGKTLGQGISAFGEQLGQGLAGAVKGAGTTFVEFANTGVGKIAALILVWHFLGHQFLWFILIMCLLYGLGKFVRNLFGEYNANGKFVKLNLAATREMGDGTIFGIYSICVGILAIVAIGAAVNF